MAQVPPPDTAVALLAPTPLLPPWPSWPSWPTWPTRSRARRGERTRPAHVGGGRRRACMENVC
eukprot:144662-Prymnesium_polylepis.1